MRMDNAEELALKAQEISAQVIRAPVLYLGPEARVPGRIT